MKPGSIGVSLTYRFGGQQTMTFRVSELITCREIILYMTEKYGTAEIVEPQPALVKKRLVDLDLDSITITKVAMCATILLARMGRGASLLCDGNSFTGSVGKGAS